MELMDLQSIWGEYDKKIAENTRLNKEILRRILITKPQKQLNWIKLKSGFNLISPIILFLPLLFVNIEFRSTLNFYIGAGLFTTLIFITYIWEVRYYLMIRKIDFAGSILSVKKGLVEMEKYKIKTTRIKYILAPLGMLGIFLMVIKKLVFSTESIVMLVSIVLIFILTIFYTFKYSIHEQFRKLNNEITEIEKLGKN